MASEHLSQSVVCFLSLEEFRSNLKKCILSLVLAYCSANKLSGNSDTRSIQNWALNKRVNTLSGFNQIEQMMSSNKVREKCQRPIRMHFRVERRIPYSAKFNFKNLTVLVGFTTFL